MFCEKNGLPFLKIGVTLGLADLKEEGKVPALKETFIKRSSDLSFERCLISHILKHDLSCWNFLVGRSL